jgi:isopenicillin N synthase-like dioxygenase
VEVLDVDLIGFETGDAARRRAVVDGVMRSLETGFVCVRHDLDEDELDACYAQLAAFFALPADEKRALEVPDSRGQRGYTGLLVETAAGSDMPDWKEHLNWGEPAPPGHPEGVRYPDRYGEPVLPEAALPGITHRLLTFHRRLAALQRRFLRIVAEGLGARADHFDAMTKHGAHLTRAVHYPPMRDVPLRDASAEGAAPTLWAAPHGDINLVTALPRATAPGLQVETDSGWLDVAPPEGHAVLNSGMMLERISNGRLPTGIHRVVAAPGQQGDRLSVVQFCHPTPGSLLAPLPSCVTTARPRRFEPVLAADWLDDVLREIGLT